MKSFLELHNMDGELISGTTTITEIGGLDVSEMIEVNSFGIGVDRQVGHDGRVTGNPTFRHLTLVKPLDKASPLLLQALANVDKLTGKLHVFGNNPETGLSEETYTIEVGDAKVIGVDWDGGAGAEPTETVEINYRVLSAIHPPTGTETQVHPE